MKKVLSLVFILLASVGLNYGQVKGIVLDQVTKKPVPFANIWVENENLGATSSEKGEFRLESGTLAGKNLVISCLGYEKANVNVSTGVLTVYLVPAAVALGEVTVKKSTRRSKLVVNKLTGHTEYSFGSNGTPWVVAQYIPYKPDYAATPFLDEISLVTLSNLKNATFKLHLLQVEKDGSPGKDLLPVPLLVTAPKGIKTVTVNVSEHDLQIPPEGLFIAFEWLILKQNRFEYLEPETGAREVSPRVSYEPSLRCYAPNTLQPNSWIFHQGQWMNNNQREGDAITSATPHFQLTLSN